MVPALVKVCISTLSLTLQASEATQQHANLRTQELVPETDDEDMVSTYRDMANAPVCS